jgi:hypothetical protein
MLRQCLKLLVVVLAGFAVLALVRSAAGQYRGVPAGWPYNTGGYYASYPVSGRNQAYYVARPVIAMQRPATVAYMPINAAYANPNYTGAYVTARAAYNPAQAATYYPQAAVTYPQAATANYAPSSGYAVSPAGSSYAGSEAATYIGQPTTVNYVAPRVTYRPALVQAPVYAYQPVVAYQVGAAPTTCYQPAPAVVAPVATTGCATKHCGRRGFLSFLNPFNWFRRRCCAAAPATTAYCAPPVVQCGTAGACGQPYYPGVPANVIPTVPAPAATIPSIRSPIIGTPTVPPPPTRSGTTIIVPAETRPSLAPGASGSFPTGPATTTPGGSFTPSPPSSSFGVPPAGTPTFPSGSNYPPAADPYAAPIISGARYHGSNSPPRTIHEPGTGEMNPRGLAPSVQPVPDPDANERRSVPSRAPQLLDPRDKTANVRLNRWAVVPAVWPTKERGGRVITPTSEASPYLQNVSAPLPAHEYEPARHFVPAPAQAEYDDGGWQSAR